MAESKKFNIDNDICGLPLDSESVRTDLNPRLGKPLSQTEQKAYELISRNALTPTTSIQIFRHLYKCDPSSEADLDNVREIIYRIRKKLGSLSLAFHKEGGYTARRAEIESKFPPKFSK